MNYLNSEDWPPTFIRYVGYTLSNTRADVYFQKNRRWDVSIGLSKQDKLFKDAITTAAASNSTEVTEELLTYFVVIGNRECFAAMLYVCFDLLRPDVVMDLSWQHGLNDFYMPYKIQSERSLTEKVWCWRSDHHHSSKLIWLSIDVTT